MQQLTANSPETRRVVPLVILKVSRVSRISLGLSTLLLCACGSAPDDENLVRFVFAPDAIVRYMEDTGIIEVTSHTLNPNDADDAATLGTLQSELEDSLQLFQSLTEQDNLRLQQAAQEQQRIMQLLSNLMKIQHDTVKAIIGNVRA